MNRNLLLILIFAAAVAYATRSLFSIREEIIVRQPPITVYDTVKTIDTVWVSKLRHRTDTLWLERFTITEPETIYVTPPMIGIQALQVPKAYGDTMTAYGFQIIPDMDSLFITRRWMATWVYAGPLEGIIAGMPPTASFYDPPRPVKSCGLFCKLSHYAVGAAGGWALCKLD